MTKSRGDNRQILLRRRCVGVPLPDDFALHQGEIPQLSSGEVLCRSLFLSLDPYIRGLISGRHKFENAMELGSVITGNSVARVEDPGDTRLARGDIVVCESGWQEFAVCKADACRLINTQDVSISTALGVLGMPGLTAYIGMKEYASPSPGETAVVSSALGPVGGTAGQIAKILGCRVIGIAGSEEKCRYAVENYGFDACINYKSENFEAALDEAAPSGIDIYFDNVGGKVLDVVVRHLAINARITLCGLISQYNDDAPLPGPALGPVIGARASMRGLVVYDHMHRINEYIDVARGWISSDQLTYKEDITVGIENAPEAFCKLMRGENLGKALVKVTP